MLGRVTARIAVTLHRLAPLRLHGRRDDPKRGLTAGTGFIQKPLSSDDPATRVGELLDDVAAA